MNDSSKDSDLDALEAFRDQLGDLMEDLDRSYRPVVLRLTARNLPGTDYLSEKFQVATSAIEELVKIVSGVHYAGGDEGAFLYWEFEISENHTEEEAIAAMGEAFDGLELEDSLLLFRKHKATLPKLPQDQRPTLHVHSPGEDERS